MTIRRLMGGAAAVVLTTAATLIALPTAPAVASGSLCSGGGVNVVVDFKSLGGGIAKGCDTDGAGRPASEVFPDAGFPLTYVTSQPGFVCKVSEAPANAACQRTPPSNAYWGLWSSDGESGSWTYTSQGVGSLKVPDGGSVAFSWVDGSGAKPPGTAAPTSATPSPAPSSGGGSGGGGGGTGGGAGSGPGGTGGNGGTGGTGSGSPSSASPTVGGTASSSPRAQRSGASSGGDDDRAGKPDPSKQPDKSKNRPSASPSAEASESASTGSVRTGSGSGGATDQVTDAVSAETDDRLPVWVPLGVLVLALAGTAGAIVVRRRSGSAG